MEHHIREDNLEAQSLLEKAVQLDPRYAAAWVYLGWTYAEDARWRWGSSPSSSLERAFELAQKSLELENDYPDSFALLGFAHMLKGETEQAIAMTEKAVTLAPNHAFIMGIAAALLRSAGRSQDAIRRIKRAMRLSPIYPAWYLMVLGSAYSLIGDQDKGIAILQESVRREPESLIPKPWLVNALIEANLTDQARSVSADIKRIEPEFSRSNWAKALGFSDSQVVQRLLDNMARAGLPE